MIAEAARTRTRDTVYREVDIAGQGERKKRSLVDGPEGVASAGKVKTYVLSVVGVL
jgi:hypothetical protein